MVPVLQSFIFGSFTCLSQCLLQAPLNRGMPADMNYDYLPL